jgi:hypothetical protein
MGILSGKNNITVAQFSSPGVFLLLVVFLRNLMDLEKNELSSCHYFVLKKIK